MREEFPLFTGGIFFILMIRKILTGSSFVKLKKIIKQPVWMFNFLIMTGFVLYITQLSDNEKHDKLKDASKKAILAFVIAMLATLELTIAPFWVVFMSAYYLNEWV